MSKNGMAYPRRFFICIMEEIVTEIPFCRRYIMTRKMRTRFETKSRHGKRRSVSQLEKFIRAFMNWASTLLPRDRAELSRLIVIVSALVAQTYLLFWILTFVLNRP